MPQQTITLGNARNVTQSVVGQVVDLIILAKLIVFRAILAMLQPTITKGNVRNAIVQVLDG
jgi:hypothetical protein